MKAVEMKPGIYWVGGIDWEIRNFHGYSTKRGTTYNSYLIMDEKVVLVDTVKHYLFDEMVQRIRSVVDPAKIDIIVANHVEMDHSGSLPRLKELCPNARIITSPMGEKGLKRHYKKDWEFQVVKTGDSVGIGKRTLAFVQVPMIHWPDSMVTYISEERLLLPNDAFGQHIACSERFDDQVDWDILREEACKYYNNIVMPYGDQVKGALEALGGLDIDMIGPSHGIIWRTRIPNILEAYTKWCTYTTDKKALIVYDTMWGSTEKMARALALGLEEAGVPFKLRCLKTNDMSDIVTDLAETRLVLIGSSTLNNGMMPSVVGFLQYIKGLRPRGRTGYAFGSYGWSGEAANDIHSIMKEMGWETPLEPKRIPYIPDDEELASVSGTGRELGKELMKGD